MLSSLPHYSIMMACGVCRTPFALIASAFSPPRFLARTSSRLSSAYSPSFSSKPIPYSFPPSFDSPFPPSLLSTFLFHVLRYLSSAFHEERERERETRLRPSRCIRARFVPPRPQRMSSLVPRFQARARVHIAVTMMCVILRWLANVNPRRCDEEGEQARGEEKKREKRGEKGRWRGRWHGGKGVVEARGDEGGWTTGQGRAETLKRFGTGSRTVAYLAPSKGGWRTSYSTRAGHGRHLVFG